MELMVITLIFVTLAAIQDLRTKRIPNLLTMSAIVLGIIINVYFSGFNGFGNSFMGFLAGIGLLIIPFVLGGMGAGDVKLLAAIGALNGPFFVFYTFLYTAISGGVIALIITMVRGRFYLVAFNAFNALQNFTVSKMLKGDFAPAYIVSSNIKFPYGIAFLSGTVITYLVGGNL